MKLIRSATLVISALAAVTSMAQTWAPFAQPAGYNGHNFWFGPGPAAHTLNSYDWDANNRAWFEYDGSSSSFQGAGGVAGSGTAFTGFVCGWGFTDVIEARSTINVRPYVYIDGYFGLISDVQGWGYSSHLYLGSSTFYILHNAPVFVHFNGFSDANQVATVGVPNGKFIKMEYSAQAYMTTPLATFTMTVPSINFGPTAGDATYYLDPVANTNFFGKIDISRYATIPYDVPAGVYRATGTVVVSSI